jgi:fatty-acyl-CoA synthase
MGRGIAPMTVDSTLHTYFRCLDEEDWEAMAGVFHPDAGLRAVGARPCRGRGSILTYFARIFELWDQHEDRPTRILVNGDTAVAEVTFTGVAVGGGQPVSFDAIDVFDLEAGRIRNMSNWYDIAYARKALKPNAPSPAAGPTQA